MSCPSIRYIPTTGFYYVITGGDKVILVRSKDLKNWELGHYNGGVVAESLPNVDCTLMAANWTAWVPSASDRDQLNKCSVWDHFASDSDLTEFRHNGEVSTLLMWQASDQASQGLSLFAQYDGDQASYFAKNFD